MLCRLVWPLYWFAQGTMFWALFVVGHDWYVSVVLLSPLPLDASFAATAEALHANFGSRYSGGAASFLEGSIGGLAAH